jgi:hypothetical protein
MVGSPSTGNFGLAEVVWRWEQSARQFVDIGEGKLSVTSDKPDCPGYFAYFARSAEVILPAPSKAGDTHTCDLSPGWNLVGNPFSLPARLPSGVSGLHWNSASGAYEAVSTIPPGSAVWIYEQASVTITITAQ